MIMLEESNPWADVAKQFGVGLNAGFSRAQDFRKKLKLEKEKNKAEMAFYKKYMEEEDDGEQEDQTEMSSSGKSFQEKLMDSGDKKKIDFKDSEPSEVVEEEEKLTLEPPEMASQQKENKAPFEEEEPVKKEPTKKIAGIPFTKGELPKKTKKIPAIGKLAPAAKLQRQEMLENKKDNKEFGKNYSNLNELRDNERALGHAKDLIYNGDVGPNFFRKSLIMLSSGKLGEYGGENLKKLAQTPDEQKLGAILMKFARPKDIGGSNPSTREVLLALERYPDILNHPEANKYLIDEMFRNAKRDLKKGQLIASLEKYDPYMQSGIFKNLVDDKVEEYEQSLGNKSPTSKGSFFSTGNPTIDNALQLFGK